VRNDELFEGVDITITAEAFADSVSHYTARSLRYSIAIFPGLPAQSQSRRPKKVR